MAVKISELPAAGTAAGTDQLEANQGGTSRRLTVAQVATHVRSTATDTVLVAAGSASAPSIAPTGDSNTGIFFPAADTIAFAEGGTEVMRIDAGNATFAGTAAMASSFLRNRIINGDMRIDQRNAGASLTVNTGNQNFSVDRWWGQGTASSGVFTMQRSSVAPAGFSNSLLVTVTTADSSLAANDLYDIAQFIEGFNVSDLGFGTASAQTITLSFWVRSSVTGTYGGALGNNAATRGYPFTYSISAANTWEYKTVTIAGDTSGTWTTDNTIGLRVYFGLGVGSTFSGTAGSWSSSFPLSATGATNLMATSGATFYLTGVQLEVGTVATPFERRLFGQELALCQRYYERFGPGYRVNFATTANTSSTQTVGVVRWRVQKRASPTVSVGGNWRTLGANQGTSTTLSIVESVAEGALAIGTVASGYTQGQANVIQSNDDNNGFVEVSAEL
jgi:hypothetical protein